jgi:3-mercaptopropionate dioxygenase
MSRRFYNTHMNRNRFTDFLSMMDAIVSRASNESTILDAGEAALRSLVAHDDWLPVQFTRSNADKYQQYLLYLDPAARYSVQSFVWAPGQGTPIHNHTVWGLVGVMRGAEQCEEFSSPILTDGAAMTCTHRHRLECGQVDRVSPTLGDWHAVSNAMTDQSSVSIHVYGADIGRVTRRVFDPVTQTIKPFVSGYSNDQAWIVKR